MNICVIDIGKDYSKYLGTRFGKYSGNDFLYRILKRKFENFDKLIIKLDSLNGYTPSFFEESFGGLVRLYGLSKILEKIEFRSKIRPYLISKIKLMMAEAEDTVK